MEKAKLKQNIFLVAFVLVVFIIGYLLYINFFKKPPQTNLPPDMIPGQENPLGDIPTPEFSEVPSGPSELKTSLLRDPRFANLKIFGSIPIEVGPVGRDIPFIPYEGYQAIIDEE